MPWNGQIASTGKQGSWSMRIFFGSLFQRLFFGSFFQRIFTLMSSKVPKQRVVSLGSFFLVGLLVSCCKVEA